MARTLVREIVDNRKNLLINGNFDFWQRGVSTTSPGIYLADRWLSGNGTTSYSRQTGGPNNLSKYFSRISGSSGTVLLNQRIESNFARQIVDNELTVSFYAKVNSGVSDIEVRVFTPDVVDDYSTITQVFSTNLGALSGSWQKFSYTFNVTSTMLSNGFQMNIGNLNAGSAIEIDLSQIMLNEGATVAPFRMAGENSAEELRLCQRYYEKSYRLDTLPGTIDTAEASYMTNVTTSIFTKATKRAAATITVYNPNSGVVGTARDYSGGVDRTCSVQVGEGISSFGLVTIGFTTNTEVLVHWTADAEL